MPCDTMIRRQLETRVKQVKPGEVESGYFELDGALLVGGPVFKRVVSSVEVPTDTAQDMLEHINAKLCNPMYSVRKRQEEEQYRKTIIKARETRKPKKKKKRRQPVQVRRSRFGSPGR